MRTIVNGYITMLVSCLFMASVYAAEVPINLFPLEHYSQNVNQWINPKDKNYNQRLISKAQQVARKQAYYQHLYATDSTSRSPWNKNYIASAFRQEPDLKSLETGIVNLYDNKGKSANRIGYGENFRPHTEQWIAAIRTNINLNQFADLSYSNQDRAIAVTNLHARVLPTNDVSFYKFSLPGQGYPFDNLQMSSVWAGTPIYIVATTRDHAWDYVITPSFFAWVASSGIARVSNQFIQQWQAAAKQQMAAITQTKTPIVANGVFRFYGYVGAVFPAQQTNRIMTLLIPVKSKAGKAKIVYASVSSKQARQMPLKATPHNFSKIISTLLNRPYGWGGMYFYNDCSAETKSLFTLFGIWLPRHSSSQVTAGKMVDESSASMQQRIDYLKNHGHPLTTIVYIGGHVILYTGNAENLKTHKSEVMTYQNLWGLRPADSSRRDVVGESVFFPLLTQYPEVPDDISLANKTYFRVAYLDEMPTMVKSVAQVDLKSLMYTESMLNQVVNN